MIEFPKYSFVQFAADHECCSCSPFYEVSDASDIAFHIKGNHEVIIAVCDLGGEIIKEIEGSFIGNWINLSDKIVLGNYLSKEDCFKLKLTYKAAKPEIYYSNVFLYNSQSDHPLVIYRGSNISFFEFSDKSYNSIRLPIHLSNRNPKTDKEEYIDANGKINNPFVQRRHVYKMETDFADTNFHEKMEVMLMHEEITIDGISVNETGDYEIDYDTEIREGDDSIPLHKATSELSTQDILLMRNY